ncbi:MAG: arsenic transporter, partial [Oscillospiraceae bacterium]|nr:arsenic transporter [Oscillospiraceae bacterium]
ISAFIDNIPYVATMLPVVTGRASIMGIEPYMLYYGLLVGATLGGNMTPIGASANITAIGILEKEGCTVKPREFMKMGVPFTLAAVITGYILIWIIF